MDRGLIDQAWKGGPILLFTVLIFLPACCEEMVFRGFILQGLLRWYRPLPAILLSAFFFGAFQMDVPVFLPYFLLGLLLGFLAYRTGSVFPAILFRLVLNTLLLGAHRPSSEITAPVAGSIANYRWMGALISLLFLLTVMFWMGLSSRRMKESFGSVRRYPGG
ncbi:MAG: type II CAAX prenyl endopeptidase Rce1 family protein [Gemmataceae bacterium]